MLNKKIKKILNQALSYSKVDQTEILFSKSNVNLTRFANSEIHQNISKENNSISVRVVLDKKIASVGFNDFSLNSIKKAIGKAVLITKFQKQDLSFISLPKPAKIKKINSFNKATADCSPYKRAQIIKKIVDLANEKNLIVSGALSTSAYEITCANSLGIFSYFPQTLAEISITITGAKNNSGYADFISININDIKPEKIAKQAIDKALLNENPVKIKPGIYEVFLEEYAVANILEYMAYLGFSGKAIEENRSFLSGKLGKKVLGKNIFIWDDGLDKRGIPMPFDFEGAAKKKVVLIKNGIFKNRVYDSYSAHKEGKVSTGHSLLQPNSIGAYPQNLFMKNGKIPKEKILKTIKKGIYITRFWYFNALHPNLLMTGMTRDGTFLIENGKITKPLKNLRFTQSFPKALSNVKTISKETKLCSSNIVCPAIKIGKFNFTSQTE
ncbi:MAG: TldD/PmbA family protein [Flavobacterium sp.]|nr:TldD/PmbA family protein [Flavobacterium sp.]